MQQLKGCRIQWARRASALLLEENSPLTYPDKHKQSYSGILEFYSVSTVQLYSKWALCKETKHEQAPGTNYNFRCWTALRKSTKKKHHLAGPCLQDDDARAAPAHSWAAQPCPTPAPVLGRGDMEASPWARSIPALQLDRAAASPSPQVSKPTGAAWWTNATAPSLMHFSCYRLNSLTRSTAFSQVRHWQSLFSSSPPNYFFTTDVKVTRDHIGISLLKLCPLDLNLSCAIFGTNARLDFLTPVESDLMLTAAPWHKDYDDTKEKQQNVILIYNYKHFCPECV